MIESPPDVIWHILGSEVGMNTTGNPSDFINTESIYKARANHKDWKIAFSQSEAINSKKLIERISRETKLFPRTSGGEVNFASIQNTYEHSDIQKEIKHQDVFNYTITRTSSDDIRTAVYVDYAYDNSTDSFTKSTKNIVNYHTAKELFDHVNPEGNWTNLFHGIPEEKEAGDAPVKSKYIQDDYTAKLYQSFLLSWYCNQHNIIKMTLPLHYMNLEVSDVIAFDGLINGKKAYGEDYSLANQEKVYRNAQEIFPIWIISETNKTAENIEIKAIQMHLLYDDSFFLTPTAVVNFNPSDIVFEGTLVTLDASSSYVPEGSPDTLVYEWESLDGVELNLSNNNEQATFTAPDVINFVYFKFRLTVTAEGGESDSIQFQVGVHNVVEDLLPTYTYNIAGQEGTHLGWQLISFPFEFPNNETAIFFEELIDNNVLQVVTGYDGGYLIYDSNYMPFLNTLQHIYPHHGYWVRGFIDYEWNITAGPLIPPTTTIDLLEGWNLVSYWGNEIPVEIAFQDLLNSNNLIFVTGYIANVGSNFMDPTLPPFLWTLKEVKPLMGYWVKTNFATTFSYPPEAFE